MPAVSTRQRKFMAAARARKRKGKPAKGDPKMSNKSFRDFMKKPTQRRRHGG